MAKKREKMTLAIVLGEATITGFKNTAQMARFHELMKASTLANYRKAIGVPKELQITSFEAMPATTVGILPEREGEEVEMMELDTYDATVKIRGVSGGSADPEAEEEEKTENPGTPDSPLDPPKTEDENPVADLAEGLGLDVPAEDEKTPGTPQEPANPPAAEPTGKGKGKGTGGALRMPKTPKAE